MGFCLPAVLVVGHKARLVVRTGIWERGACWDHMHLLHHHLGLRLINSVCIQGMNRGRQGEEGRQRINSLCT